MNFLTYGEMNAKNALRERGKSISGTLNRPQVLHLRAVSLTAVVELYQENKTLVDISLQTLHFGAHLLKIPPLSAGLEASCSVKTFTSFPFTEPHVCNLGEFFSNRLVIR